MRLDRVTVAMLLLVEEALVQQAGAVAATGKDPCPSSPASSVSSVGDAEDMEPTQVRLEPEPTLEPEPEPRATQEPAGGQRPGSGGALAMTASTPAGSGSAGVEGAAAVLAPAGAPEQAQAVLEAVPGRFRCVKRAILRTGFGVGTARCGAVEVGECVQLEETRATSEGTQRVRCAGRGWASAVSGVTGEVLFEVAAAGAGAEDTAGSQAEPAFQGRHLQFLRNLARSRREGAAESEKEREERCAAVLRAPDVQPLTRARELLLRRPTAAGLCGYCSELRCWPRQGVAAVAVARPGARAVQRGWAVGGKQATAAAAGADRSGRGE